MGQDRSPVAEKVERLIAQLGSDQFEERDAAGKGLQTIGEPALDALRKAASDHPDPEVKGRARRLVEQIVEQVGKSNLIKHSRGPRVAVSTMAFSPDGLKVLSGSGEAADGEKEEMVDHTLRLWEWKAEKELLCLKGHPGRIGDVSFSPDGRLALSIGIEDEKVDSTIRLWSLETGKELRQLTGHTSPVYSARFSPDCRLVLTSGNDLTVRLWDAETGKELRRFNFWGRPLAVFSPDGRQILATGYAGRHMSVGLIDAKTGDFVRQFGDDHWGLQFAFSPDGKRVVVGDSHRPKPGAEPVGRVQLWDVEGKLLRCFEGHQDMVVRVAFSPDGKRLLSASRKADVRLWDVESGKELRHFTPHKSFTLALAFTADGKQALTGHADNSVCVWNLPE